MAGCSLLAAVLQQQPHSPRQSPTVGPERLMPPLRASTSSSSSSSSWAAEDSGHDCSARTCDPHKSTQLTHNCPATVPCSYHARCNWRLAALCGHLC